MAKRSRQRKTPVRVAEIRELSLLQVSEKEAAAVLGVKLSTFKEMLRIDERARDAWERGREEGKVSIRRKQFSLAGSNASMAIFLGKQYLGQSEINVIEHSGRNGGPIKTLDLGKLDAKGRAGLREALQQARVKKD